MEITKDTKISEIIKEKPEAIEILFGVGLGCIGCPMAQMETIEQGCKAHGMSDEDVEEVIKKLNEKSSEQTKGKDSENKEEKETK